MSLIEHHKAFEEAVRADERQKMGAKMHAVKAALNKALILMDGHIGNDTQEEIERPKTPTRKRSVDARITEEDIIAVASALESLPPDPRHNGVKPKQLKHLLPSFGYKTIGACARELAKRGKVTVKAGRYLWLDIEPNGIEPKVEAEAEA